MAIALAGDYLRAGKLDAAIVGGISYFSFGGMIHFSNAQAASDLGSRPFDEGADGFIPGEGCAYAVIKTLSRALTDGDRILAVVRGLGISSDGKGKGLWAPRKEGQTLAIQRAYRDQGLTFQDMDYIEAHATSTALGDATELNAMMDAYSGLLPDKVWLTSHKANIGHVFEAAGMAGIIKVLLAMRNKTIPPQIHFQQPTSEFEWNGSPFVVPTEPATWQPRQNKPRRAGINAFGIGGLNGHIVLEEPSVDPLHKPHMNMESPQPLQPVAIVGMGVVLPGALNCDDFLDVLRSGKDLRSAIPEDRNDLLMTREELVESRHLRGGFMNGWQYNWRRHKIPPNQIAKANPLQFMMLGAVDEAVENAGLAAKLDSTRTAVVVGTRSDSDFLTVLNMVLFMPELRDLFEKTLRNHATDQSTADRLGESFAEHLYREYPSLDDQTGSFTISTLASRVTKAYDLMGGAVAIDGGLSGGMIALENAMHRLQNGEIDTVICVSGHRAMGYWRYEELRQSGMLSQNMQSVLDENADGVVPAEGACAVVLRRLNDARKDGNTIRGILHSVAGMAVPDDPEEAAKQVMTQSHAQAEVPGESVSFCGFACSGDTRRDQAVLKILAEKLRPEKRHHPAAIASEISQIGHTGAAAGLISLIRTVLEMEQLESFGNVGMTRPNSAIRENTAALRCESSVTPNPCWNETGRVFATVTNIDPCGIVYHAVLERGTKVEMPSRKVATLTAPECVKTRYLRQKTAFLFPGQGAQRSGMLRKLAAEYKPLAERIKEIDVILADLNLPTFPDMAWENGKLLGHDVLRTQLSVLVADSLMMSLLEERGLVPDMVLGHSYGEYPALVAAGAWSFETAALATAKRCEAIVQAVGSGTGMLSTHADETVLHRLFAEIDGRLYISNRNSRDQTIVSGHDKDLKKLETALKREKKTSVNLPVPAAFHSPWVAGVCKPLETALADCRMQPPHHLLLSSIGAQFVADPEIIRGNLVRQMIEPVDFVRMVERAYENGCRVFVEVGPRRILTNMVRNILSDQDEVAILACDDGKEGNLALFDEVCQFLEKHRDSRSYRKTVLWRDTEPDAPVEGAELQRTAATDEPSHQCLDLPEGCRYFELSGTPYQMGFAYGRHDAERIRKTLRRYADMAMQPGNVLPDTRDDIRQRLNLLWTQDDLEELRGMADGAGVPWDALLRHNLSVFPESDTASQQVLAIRLEKRRQTVSVSHPPSGGCVHFAGKTRDLAFVHGGNLDAPLARMLHGTLGCTLIRRCHAGKIPYVSMGIVGRLGEIGGINQRGLCVSSCILLDMPRTEKNTCGSLHTSIVTQVLSGAETLEQAAAIVESHAGTGGWTMLVCDLSDGRMVHIEYNGSHVCVNNQPTFFMQANHGVSATFRNQGTVPSHSIHRLKRLEALLNVGADERFAGDSEATFRSLRDAFDIERNRVPEHRTMNSIWRTDNVFSWQVDARAMTLRIALTRKTDAEDHESQWKTVPLDTVLPGIRLTPKTGWDVPNCSAANRRYRSTDYDTFLKRNTALHGNCPVKLRDSVAERFVNRMVETALLSDVQSVAFPGTVLIYGDKCNAVADLLEERIRKDGGKTFRIDEWREDGQSAEALDKLWNESPFYTLFLVNSHDQDATSYDSHASWKKRFEQGMIGPTLTAQYLYAKLSENKQLGQMELFVAARLGGDFGLSLQVQSVEGAGNNGVAKAIFIEAIAIHSQTLHVRSVDHWNGAATETVVQNLLNEYAYREMNLEVGYFEHRRYLCKMLSTCVGAGKEKSLHGIKILDELDISEWVDSFTRRNNHPMRPAWIITGGARGICAEIAYAIAKFRNAKLYMIGSSPAPDVEESWKNLDEDGLNRLKASVIKDAVASKTGKPMDAWEKVKKSLEIDAFFAKLNAEQIPFEYYCCDVTDQQAVGETISSILAQEKSIEGFIHGAGFEQSTRVEKKKSEAIRKTIAVKVTGAFNILQALKGCEPKFLIGMGSISGRLGASGQLDYVAANELLCKLFAEYMAKNPQTKATTIHWTGWDDVGMAARPESRMALKATGMVFIPKTEALSFLLSELNYGLYEREITVLGWNYYKIFFSDQSCIFPLPASGSEKKSPVLISPVENVWQICAEDFKSLNLSVNEHSPINQEQNLFRYVVRMLERPLPKNDNIFPKTNGVVLIVGDNETAVQVQEKLQEKGLHVVTLPNGISMDEVENRLKELACENPIDHVLCLGSYDREFDVSPRVLCEADVDKHAFVLIKACRQIIIMARERNALDRLTFTAATRFGGTFSLTGDSSVSIGGVAAGLLKAINDELRMRDSLFVPIRIIDHNDLASQDEVVSHIFDEICDVISAVPLKNKVPVETLLSAPARAGHWSPHDMEVGYKDNVRYVARTVPLPLEPLPAGYALEKPVGRISRSFDKSKSFVSTGGTWIVVGGLRGITNACADALAGVYRPQKIIAVGSASYEELGAEYLDDQSPAVAMKKKQAVTESVQTRQSFTKVWSLFTRNQEMTRNLKKMRQSGIEVEYRICNMCSWDEVSRFVESLDKNGEMVTGVINGAMFDGADNAFEKAVWTEVQHGLNTKLVGNIVLLEKLVHHPLEFFVGFGSVSGRFGGNGQTIYTAANDCLAKLLGENQRRYPNCRFTCFEWGAWSQIGISWRPNIRGLHAAAGTVFIAPEEGIRHFLREFEYGLPELEALFVAWKYYKRFQPDAIHDVFPVENPPSSHEAPSLAPVMGDNADARAIARLNLADCLVMAQGRDLEGLAVVPRANREQWFETRVFPALNALESRIRDDSASRPSRVIVLTATRDIPDGGKILEKMKSLQKTADDLGRSVRFEYVDLPLDIPPNDVARRIQKLAADEKSENVQQAIKEKSGASSLLFVEKLLEQSPGRVGFQVTVDPQKDTFLLEHQVRNRPILPVVAAMEMMAEAAMLTGNSPPLQMIRNLKIQRGMSCTVDKPYRLTVVAEKSESHDGSPKWQTKITGDYYNPEGNLINEKCPYFSCELVFADREWITADLPPQGKQRWRIEYPDFGTFPIYHGPPLRGLKYVDFDNGEFLTGKIHCISQKSLFQSRWNETHNLKQSVLLNPSLIDACLYAAGVLHGIDNANTSILPDHFKELKIGAGEVAVGESCMVVVKSQGDVKLPMGYRNRIFDFILSNNAGEIVYQVKGFRATEVRVKKSSP